MARTLRRQVGSLGMWLFVVLVVLFIILPIIIVMVMSFNYGRYFIFPPTQPSTRWYSEAVVRTEWRQAFFISLWIAALTALGSTIVGTGAALALARGRFRGRQALGGFFMSPLVLPQLLLGLALLFFLARIGIVGSPVTLLLGHIVVTFPYALRILLSALGSVPPSVEEAAMTLGADELTTTIQVTLPIIRPAVISAMAFAFILSFDNVMISLFLASARIITLPVKILNTIEQTSDPTIAAISSIFVVISLVLLIIVERVAGLKFISGVGIQ
jgi:putative spermidine/putrescine transport system permease protein